MDIQQIMQEIVSLKDFEQLAKKRLLPEFFGYISSGADEQITLHENQNAFDKLYLNPRILVDVKNLSLKKTILGFECSLPFGLAPSAMHKIAHQDGELITATIASQANICMTLSTLSTKSFSEIKKINPNGLKLMQLYINKDRKITQTLVRLAQKYEFHGLVVTVDCQVIGKRIIDQRNKFIYPPNIKFQVLEQIQANLIPDDNNNHKSSSNLQRKSFAQNRDLTLNWDFIKWIKGFTRLPIILKGITSIQSALLANEYKADAIWISNHGGRQLDTISSTIQILPQISSALKAIKSNIEIFIDGGIRRGTDVYKCLAYGANYVFIGRPLIYSLVLGYEGARKMIKILKQELQTTMRLMGVKSIDEINSNQIITLNSRL